MKEPMDNIRMCCPECGLEPLTDLEKDSLYAGQFVKIVDNGERFWLRILFIQGDRLTCRVENDLIREHSFKCNDVIEVTKDELIGVFIEPIRALEDGHIASTPK